MTTSEGYGFWLRFWKARGAKKIKLNLAEGKRLPFERVGADDTAALAVLIRLTNDCELVG
jgi:hypothetical protein